MPPRQHALAIFACSVLMFAPAFVAGAGGFDLHAQSLWSRAFADQFFAGDLYPRWFMSLFAGAGSPAFFYNPPLPFYGLLPFHFLQGLDEWGYYPLVGGAWLAVLLSGFAMHAWLRDVRLAPSATLVGSLLYMLMPNHVAQNFYGMMLYASVWAYVPLPLLFLYAGRLARGESGGVTGYAMALGLLLLIHTISVILFGPITAAYFLLQLPREDRIRRVRRAAGAILLGFALSAIFMVPCLAYLPFISVTLDAFTLQTKEIFFFTASTPKALLYIAYWAASLLLTVALIRPARTVPAGRFFLIIAALALVLMLPITEWLWTHVPFLHIVQLAERLFMVTAVAHAYLLAQLWPRWRGVTAAVVLGCVFALALGLTHRTPTVDAYAAKYPSRAASYRMGIEQYAATLPDRDMIRRYGTAEGREAIRANNQRVRIMIGAGRAHITQWQPRHITAALTMRTAGTVRIRQFPFYGFTAQVDGTLVDLTRDTTTGFLMVDVPQGTHELCVTLQALLPEKLGACISLVALAVWLILWLSEKRRRA